jgi:hypothetical protein
MKRIPRSTQSGEAEKLDELVEQTMKDLAERDADVALLAKLDRLRVQVRQTLRRSRV